MVTVTCSSSYKSHDARCIRELAHNLYNFQTLISSDSKGWSAGEHLDARSQTKESCYFLFHVYVCLVRGNAVGVWFGKDVGGGCCSMAVEIHYKARSQRPGGQELLQSYLSGGVIVCPIVLVQRSRFCSEIYLNIERERKVLIWE